MTLEYGKLIGDGVWGVKQATDWRNGLAREWVIPGPKEALEEIIGRCQTLEMFFSESGIQWT